MTHSHDGPGLALARLFIYLFYFLPPGHLVLIFGSKFSEVAKHMNSIVQKSVSVKRTTMVTRNVQYEQLLDLLAEPQLFFSIFTAYFP